MTPARTWNFSNARVVVEASASESEEESPVEASFAQDRSHDLLVAVQPQHGRMGWYVRGALLSIVGIAAVATVGLRRPGLLPRVSVAQVESKVMAEVAQENEPACLCLFDVDRTLTGKQQMVDKCPGNTVKSGIWDGAFSGGDLTLSQLAQGVKSTFCNICHRGIVSAGTAGGPAEKAVLLEQLDTPSEAAVWSGPGSIKSPFVIGCPNPIKADCAKGIVEWYASTKGIVIPPQEVYFFDDLTGNTNGFAKHGFNARQVSCNTRDGPTASLGFCGATSSEIVRAKGIKNC